MPTIRVPPGQVGALIRATARKSPQAVRAGVRVAAERARSFLTTKSPVYTGVHKNAWAVVAQLAGAVLAKVENTSPYAGVIERGARPHRISLDGWLALREWVRIKLFRPTITRGKNKGKLSSRIVSGPEASSPGPMKGAQGPWGKYGREIDRITNAIAWKIRKHGQKGKFLVRDNLPKFGKWARDEVLEQIARLHGGGP